MPPSTGSSGIAIDTGTGDDGLGADVFPLVVCLVGFGNDVDVVPARVSPRDFGIANIRT